MGLAAFVILGKNDIFVINHNFRNEKNYCICGSGGVHFSM